MKPDRDAIRALRPGARITADGIEIERRSYGDIRYRAAFRIDGQRIHRVIGFESQGMTWPRARAYAEKLRTEAREGRLQLPKGRKMPLSFAEAAEKYLVLLQETGGKNITRKAMQIRRHLIPVLGAQRLDALDGFTLLRYRKARREKGASEATCNREMAVVSQLLSVALAERWISSRPCRVPRTMETRKPRVLLSDAEQQALLDASLEDSNGYLWVFICFGMATAMRHGEIVAVRFEQVDFENCRLVIPDAKAGDRLQPITPELRDLLRRERDQAEDEAGWIFPRRPGNPSAGHIREMTEPFRRAVIRAGLDPKRVTPHLLRHGGITRVLQAGADLRTAQAISGHKTVSMLLHYAHTARPEIDRAMEALRRPLPSAVAPNVTQTSPGPATVTAEEARKRSGRRTSR
jgi:integrase